MALDARTIADRVQLIRTRNSARDRDYMKLMAIRRGDYESVAPGLFSAEFDKPLVANLIDTSARDISEVMAPLPTIGCQTSALTSAADQKRQELREAIANGYVQHSRLQDQMFGGADRYVSFGYFAYITEPDYADRLPCIRVDDASMGYYVNDYMGRTRQYFTVSKVPADALVQQFSDREDSLGLRARFRAQYGDPWLSSTLVTIARWYDDDDQCLVLLDKNPLILASYPNPLKRCPVRIVERPKLQGSDGPRGQFDDVLWVQVARALVQQYTLNAVQQSVEAPLVMPTDVQEIEMGPFTTIQTDNPAGVGRVNLSISQGVFPEAQILTQEQRLGSRYPEGRSGNIDASVITGQGVQALMGTFDTQIQTFQRLNTTALEDVMAMCFEMDEKLWPNESKTFRIKDNGSPRTYTYTPAKDIKGDYSSDVTYGAIAGLDPNRGLVFVLQALAGGLIAKKTARKTLPVDLNVAAEEKQIQLEHLDEAMGSAISQLPLAIPQMAAAGADPRDIVNQVAQVFRLVQKGQAMVDAVQTVFAPPEAPQPPVSPLDQAQGAGAGPAALPGAGSGGASDLLMSLAGLTNRGKPNLQSNVSREQPVPPGAA